MLCETDLSFCGYCYVSYSVGHLGAVLGKESRGVLKEDEMKEYGPSAAKQLTPVHQQHPPAHHKHSILTWKHRL